MTDALKPPKLILASKSPRRAALLREAGLVFKQRVPEFDDPAQPTDHAEPVTHAMDLAQQKAMSLAEELLNESLVGPVILVAADTICVGTDGSLIGQPADRSAACEMIQSFTNVTHNVVTGVALMVIGTQKHAVAAADCEIICFSDVVPVTFGELGIDELDQYLSTNQWQGKAGGYNLFDRQVAGWPITVPEKCDPSTVVGLPMKKLLQELARFGIKV